LISLAGANVNLLRKNGPLPAGINTEQVTADSVANLDHQLLTNWIRVNAIRS
jgi:hypothetical protein